MTFILLGETDKNLNLSPDEEFIFPNNGWTFASNKDLVYLFKDHRKYSFNWNISQCLIFKSLGFEMWLLTSYHRPFLIYIENNRLIFKSISSRYHISEKGIYYWDKFSGIKFFDFKEKKDFILYILEISYLSFSKKYLIVEKSDITQIYINTLDLPQDLDLNLLLQEEEDYNFFTNKEVKVNFVDTSKIYSVEELNEFNSSFIYGQLENGSEIFLDIKLEEFDLENIETLKYLKSKTAYRFFLLKTLTQTLA